MKRRFLLPALAVAAAASLAGCSRSESSAPASASATPAPAADGATTIALSADDTMKFNLAEIRAKPGEKLRISLTNKGRMPKQAMAHNWVLLRPMSDGDFNAFGLKAAGSPPDYLPPDRPGVIAHTRLLGPGETDTIELNAPATAGEYPFLCTFPGHFAIMKGKVIVR